MNHLNISDADLNPLLPFWAFLLHHELMLTWPQSMLGFVLKLSPWLSPTIYGKKLRHRIQSFWIPLGGYVRLDRM